MTIMKTLKILTALIFLVLFNALFFLLGGTDQCAASWISYGFITTAYLLLLATPLFAPKTKGLDVLTASLYPRAISYFIIELIVGSILIALQLENITWPLIIQSIGLAIFLVWQLMSIMANYNTEASIRKQRMESAYVKTLAMQVRSALRIMGDNPLRNSVIRCYESLNNCSVETFPEAQDAERSLRNAVEMLCNAIDDNDNAQIESNVKRVLNAIQTRNDIIKQCRING